jgi:hypothetical protein
MDLSCLNHPLTEVETVMDQLNTVYRPYKGKGPHEALVIHDFIGKDPVFLTLLDWPKTILKVCGILGWNIQLYHSDYRFTPPLPVEERGPKQRLRWHQDSGRLNRELEGNPRPRVSLKIAFFISDTSEPGSGNFHVIPGTHLQNKLEFPEDGITNPEGTTPILAPPGSAVFFDRRLWHSASPNHSDHPRKVLFYGYSYRWLRPRDNVTAGHIWNQLDPIQKQLLGSSANGGFGYTSPRDEDVPLKLWMQEHLGEEAIAN